MATDLELSSKNRIPFLKLSCAVQTYSWGKVGRNSEVAKLKLSDSTFILREGVSYAELWMGTHPKGPSIITFPDHFQGVPLHQWINDNPSSLGDTHQEFGRTLPFLFKVLSIDKALSIQAHPTKEHAKILHSDSPQHYPDANHKPEMVIALSSFEGFCGFRPFSEIKAFITKILELRKVIGLQLSAKVLQCDIADESITKDLLKECFTVLMTQSSDIISTELDNLISRMDEISITNEEKELLSKLYSWYPGDVGCFCLFFLNMVKLKPGESLYLAPNVPHSYVKGDVIECMACSDNVVRAGLTSKYRDEETLCSMLIYEGKPASENIFLPHPHQFKKEITVYDPPIPDFAVNRIEFHDSFTLPAIAGPSILLVLAGMGTLINQISVAYGYGDVYFVPANETVTFVCKEDIPSTIYQSYCTVVQC